jgi:hypothetical protein
VIDGGSRASIYTRFRAWAAVIKLQWDNQLAVPIAPALLLLDYPDEGPCSSVGPKIGGSLGEWHSAMNNIECDQTDTGRLHAPHAPHMAGQIHQKAPGKWKRHIRGHIQYGKMKRRNSTMGTAVRSILSAIGAYRSLGSALLDLGI